MTTDIRAAAAKAAREWQADTIGPWTTRSACEAGYLLGHAAGYEAGARAFAEWVVRVEMEDWIYWEVEHRQHVSSKDMFARFLASRPAPGTAATSRVGASCLCPTECDCENPEPADGCAGVSVHCPVHNYRPRPYPNCPVHSGTDEVKP